ncbi:MAG: hypothetical protein HY682_02090 [Chloroflexi bacterium]|nr:hypothetical protein [Chloroflexota bacterium]
MRITDIKSYLTMPVDGLAWLFVEVETDEGIIGLGECTDYLSNPHLVRGLEAVKPLVVGADPSHIEEIWQRLFHAYSDLNGRGYVSHLISAIDIALWDIKGKVLGVPIYDLLGGPVRECVPLYTHVPDQGHQVCMSTPNLYRQECVHTWFDTFAKMITPMFEIRNGAIYPSGRPGLGIELVKEEVNRHLVDVDDPKALPGWWWSGDGVEPVSGRRVGARAGTGARSGRRR